MFNPESIWQDAHANDGLRLEFPSAKTAVAGRHKLYRWRKRFGGYADITIRTDGRYLVMERHDVKITTLDNKPVEGSLDEAALDFKKEILGDQ